MDTFEQLRAGFAFLSDKIGNSAAVDGDTPTPCEDWTLRQLLNHAIRANELLGRSVAGESIEAAEFDPAAMAEVDAGPDPQSAWNATAASTLAAIAEPGALDRPVTLAMGEMPGAVVANVVLADAVVHGWDVAKATGQDPTIPAALIEPVRGFLGNMLKPNMRGRGFGPEVEVPAGASPTDQLIAFTGRRP